MKPFPGFLFLLISYVGYAQVGDYALGGQSFAMGNANTAMPGSFSAFTNIGSAAFTEHSSVHFSAGNLFSVDGLNIIGAGYQGRLRKGVIAFSLFRFGDQLLNEQKAGIGYSHRIRFVSLGIQVNYLQIKAESYDSSGSFIIEFGGLAEIAPGILIGAYIFNINQPVTGVPREEQLPAFLKAGLSFQVSENLTLNVDSQQRINVQPVISSGIDYLLRDKIFLRWGLRTGPVQYYTGFGLPLRKFVLNYAIGIHPLLGFSNQLSVEYQISEK